MAHVQISKQFHRYLEKQTEKGESVEEYLKEKTEFMEPKKSI